MTYIVSGVDPAQFSHLFGRSDEELEAAGARRRRVVAGATIPERAELRDAPVGSDLLLVNYVYQPARNPYHGSHAIFIREGATERVVVADQVPDVLRSRLISLRAFDGEDMLTAADAVPGDALEPLIIEYLARPEVAYLHAHYAKPGCFAALITRSAVG